MKKESEGAMTLRKRRTVRAKPEEASYSSLERIVDMLLLFASSSAVSSAQDIERTFGTSRSSTYRYLQILRVRGLIEEVSPPGHYRLGSQFIALVRGHVDHHELVVAAEPVMRRLMKTTSETVLLNKRVGDRVLCVASVDSQQVLRVSLDPARNVPLHVGSSAKLLLAHMEPKEARRILERPLERITPNTITDPEALSRELEAIRCRGYAISDGELELGVRSVSVPIRDPGSGEVLAALTIAGPQFRLKDAVQPRLVEQAAEAAMEIASALATSKPGPIRVGHSLVSTVRSASGAG